MRFLQERWKDLFSRKERELELEEELQFHLSMQAQKNSQDGMNAEEAKRSAILQLGGLEQIKEATREERFGFVFETLLKDILYSCRVLRKTAALTFVCLITLTLAIAASTTIFSILQAVVLRPLPYPEPDRIVEVVETNKAKGIERSEVNARNVEDWRMQASEFDGIAAYFTMGRTLSGGNNESEVLLASQVTAQFFRVFKTKALVGRIFTEEETERTHYNSAVGLMSPDPLAILSYRLWMRRFGGDPNVVGKTIMLDRRAWKVIGVMPRHFAMPDERTDLWIPWGLQKDSARDQHFAGGVARLANGVSLQQAEDQLNRIADQLALEFPETNQGWSVRINSFQETITKDTRPLLWFLLAAVGLVTLITCVNIGIIQLSRGAARMRESTVRMALGASRFRLIRQFLIESLLVAMAAAVSGVLLARVAIAGLQHLQPNLPRVSEIEINSTVIFVAIAITACAALVFGLVPAFVATRRRISIFSGEFVRNTSRPSTQRFRSILVITEVALAVLLLSSSGLLIRSYLHLQKVNAGFNPKNVLVLPVFLDSEKYNSGNKSRAYYKELLGRLQRLPNVVSAGGATALPASPLGPDFERPIWEQGGLSEDQNKRHADVRIVTTDYFRTLGISVLRGRGFSAHDGPDAPGVVIINESVAKQIWPGEDPVGKQLVVDYSTAGTYPYQVIGVVNDVRFRGPRIPPRPEIYFSHLQRPYLVLNIALRTKGEPEQLVAPVREVLRSIDPDKPAHNIATLEQLVSAKVMRDRYAMGLVTSFALLSVLLASLGIYGLLAFFVRQKTQEIGIRLALGARQNQILTWITSQGALLTLCGVVAGLMAALAVSRFISGILFQVSSRDLISLGAATLTIALTALVAAWIPARRACRIDPNIALRYE